MSDTDERSRTTMAEDGRYTNARPERCVVCGETLPRGTAAVGLASVGERREVYFAHQFPAHSPQECLAALKRASGWEA